MIRQCGREVEQMVKARVNTQNVRDSKNLVRPRRTEFQPSVQHRDMRNIGSGSTIGSCSDFRRLQYRYIKRLLTTTSLLCSILLFF